MIGEGAIVLGNAPPLLNFDLWREKGDWGNEAPISTPWESSYYFKNQNESIHIHIHFLQFQGERRKIYPQPMFDKWFLATSHP